MPSTISNGNVVRRPARLMVFINCFKNCIVLKKLYRLQNTRAQWNRRDQKIESNNFWTPTIQHRNIRVWRCLIEPMSQSISIVWSSIGGVAVGSSRVNALLWKKGWIRISRPTLRINTSWMYKRQWKLISTFTPLNCSSISSHAQKWQTVWESSETSVTIPFIVKQNRKSGVI